LGVRIQIENRRSNEPEERDPRFMRKLDRQARRRRHCAYDRHAGQPRFSTISNDPRPLTSNARSPSGMRPSSTIARRPCRLVTADILSGSLAFASQGEQRRRVQPSRFVEHSLTVAEGLRKLGGDRRGHVAADCQR